MATTDNAAKLHYQPTLLILQRIWDATPDMTNRDRMAFLTKLGAFDVSRLLEICRHVETGIALDSRKGRDHADGANSKFATYGPANGQYTAYGWKIKVSNCEGDVVGWLSKPNSDEHYDVHIPKSAIKPGQRFITVTDCVEGGPQAGKWGKFITKQAERKVSFSFT